ncbi:hypothetical protein ABBQ38_004073 [Trebouxia sp. C0009 RCD-2024]
MGSMISTAEAKEPALDGPPAGLAGVQSGFLPPAAAAIAMQSGARKSMTDYHSLPCPVKYEELQREALMSLKPDLFEGLKFDFSKPLNMNFAVTHSIYMGNVEMPMGAPGATLKVPVGTYEFGANLISSKGDMMIGRISNDGRLTGRVKYDINDMISGKLQLQLVPDEAQSHIMGDIDLKGRDWNSQIKLGNGGFYGFNYLQSVTPKLALGGETFYLSQAMKSGVGFAARHQGDQHVATAQIATTGLISLNYAHKLSEKVTLASDFMWNWNQREPSASFGYDYMLRQCRLRGKVDTDGKVGAYLEERVNVGVNFILSAELDHPKKDYKFGFGMTVGE